MATRGKSAIGSLVEGSTGTCCCATCRPVEAPCHPWQRGSHENTNGLLRQYFPKGRTEFNPLTQTDLDDVAELLKTRPRKPSPGTPAEKLDELLHA